MSGQETKKPNGRLRFVVRDGASVLQLQCPECGKWGDIDEDQANGRISTDHSHDGCTFHETRNWLEEADWATEWSQEVKNHPHQWPEPLKQGASP